MKSFVPDIPLYIDETLVISSLGFDAATVVAAMRAGLSRPNPLTGFSVTADDGDEMDVSGHPVNLLTYGFEGAGRYRQLLGRMFADVNTTLQIKYSADTGSRQGKSPPPMTESAPVYLLVGVPDHRRYRQGKHVETNAELTEKQDVFSLFGETWQSLIEKSLAANGLSERFIATKVVELSVANTPQLLQMAHEALKRDPRACIVIVTVDTLTDEPGLTWLYHTGRLKTAIYPVGTSPGECINALFVSCRKSSVSTLRIESIHFDHEEHDLFDERPPQGKALSRLLQKFATVNDQEKPHKLWLISNLSGEQKPSFEWGMAQVHCQAANLEINEFPWLPAINVGDVGIAYMNLAVAWAAQAFKRDYAMAPRCGIASLDHRNTRSLLSVSRV